MACRLLAVCFALILVQLLVGVGSFNLHVSKPRSMQQLWSSPQSLHSQTTVKGLKTLAVDYGTKRIGLAVGLGIAPRPLAVITNYGNDTQLARDIIVFGRGEALTNYVVGLPLDR